MSWWKILLGVLGGAVILAAGLLIGHFGITKTKMINPEWAEELAQDVDEAFIQEFMKEVDNKRIEETLKELSKKPHMATTSGDERLVNLILGLWKDKEFGLDDAKEERYDVYLSFPDKARPNNVKVLTANGDNPFTARLQEEGLTLDQNDPDVVQPYAAYAPSGNPQGRLVYANQGKLSDFQYLADNSITLNGTIAIVRYGGAGRSAKAINAARFGVVGIIVYTDPKDINDGQAQQSQTYPNSWYMPQSGVERGAYSEDFGDPLTPYYPAKGNSILGPKSEIRGIPPIPAQPIGFEDVPCLNNLCIIILCQITVLRLHCLFTDRYVMYGNHRDSWVHGAIDPSSGTAVMLEMTRILGTKVKQGKWRPRRSIIFGSWGAEEFGLIGSTEFAEDYYSKLRDRTAAYINVDISVFANATLRAQGTPPVQDVIFTAAKQVQTPSSSPLSVYDNWIRHANRFSTLYQKTVPQLGTLGAGSDYAPFLNYLGITCMDISYTYDRNKTSARIYPAYHTAFDWFTSHQMVTRTAGNILLRLSDSLILPLGPLDYWETLDSYYNTAESNFGNTLSSKDISLAPLKAAIERYKKASEALHKTINELKHDNERPLRVRMINDQIMLLERAFINHYAFPEKRYYSHVLWASRSSSVVTFPGLADAYEKASASNLNEDWDLVHHHLTIAVYAVTNAASTLETAASI
uniref:Aminopeptidase NAALADL1 n=1 Tax=Xenopus tropicalis TaxID=8364 RepID=A0A6I8S202_XENTR